MPEVKVKDLSRLVLEVLSSLNTVQKNKDTLIDIAADGQISSDEIKDFVHIKKELENISMTVDALQLWAEKMVSTGAIDKELYEKYMEEYE